MKGSKSTTTLMALLLALSLLLASCAPQPAPQPLTINVQIPTAVPQPQAPQQQQQQSQTVIINPPVVEPPVVIVPVPVAPAYCGGLRKSYLWPGETVRVSTDPPWTNYLRACDSKGCRYLGSIPPNTHLRLLDGPHYDCNNYVIYWHVRILDTDKILDRQKGLDPKSVYTAETDTTQIPWLVP